jgi:hypothetical protein
LIGAVDADWTELSRNPFLLSLFSSSRQQLSLSRSALSLLSRSLSHVCVGVGEQKKGRRKDEGGEERDVREGEGEEKKERKKREMRGGGAAVHVAFGEKRGDKILSSHPTTG